MRLFIAILLDEPCKSLLGMAQDCLRGGAVQGNFTRRENLHLTLAFLGETGRVDAVRAAMAEIHSPAFPLTLRGVGKFPRQGGDVWWMGVSENPPLETLYRQLSEALRRRGFQLESRPFRPHLTLAREVLLTPGFDLSALRNLPSRTMRVEGISLMKSERLAGRLTYTELFSLPLDRNL